MPGTDVNAARLPLRGQPTAEFAELPHHAVGGKPGEVGLRTPDRGSERGRIRLLYEARKKEPPAWLPFEALRTNALFHSEQGWGSYLDLGIGDRTIRFTPIVAFDYADDLVEEYSGYGLRFETRKLGTWRLGASLEYSWFDTDWRTPTLDALTFTPEVPRP